MFVIFAIEIKPNMAILKHLTVT